MGKQKSAEKKWVLSNSMENKEVEQEKENGDEDEALSLCDLPNKQENQCKKESPARSRNDEVGEEEFDFCSRGGSLKESEMCAADVVFFQGQILPLRHSISSEGASVGLRSNSRCNSMDRCHSVGYTSASSRSSSTRSHQSSSSATSSTTTPPCKHPRIRNQFQYSQPSPTPQIRLSKVSHGHTVNNYTRNSTLWSLFRVGLVTMPEIGSQNFRIRNRDNDNNSNRSKVVRSGSSSSGITNVDSRINITKKLKQRFVDKNLVFFDTCKCSVNSVETIPSRSAKGQDEKKNKKEQVAAGKQAMSRIRTFEWLKQLSLEGETAITG